VHFTIRKLWLFPVHGQFTRASGTLDVRADSHQSRLVAAVAADSFVTRNPRRDRHVIGPAFLDAGHHPMLRFESTEVGPTPDGVWTVEGILTVRGVGVPVTFAARPRGSVEAGRFTVVARTTLRRSDFGVTAYGWLAGDELQVHVEAELRLDRTS
jgi:polyisoprenoid-binding protein YceI